MRGISRCSKAWAQIVWANCAEFCRTVCNSFFGIGTRFRAENCACFGAPPGFPLRSPSAFEISPQKRKTKPMQLRDFSEQPFLLLSCCVPAIACQPKSYLPSRSKTEVGSRCTLNEMFFTPKIRQCSSAEGVGSGSQLHTQLHRAQNHHASLGMLT